MEIEALVRKGADKDRCEDRCLMHRSVLCDVDGHCAIEPPFMVAVADGVGGNRLGDMAAGYVLQNMACADVDDIRSADELRSFICARNDELIDLSSGIAGARNMATTLTGILVNRHGAWLFHAGNTRIYSVEGAHIRRLTRDHTTYAWLMNEGRMAEARMCNRSEITCCLGGGMATLLSQLEILPLEDFTALLMTSDGIHDILDDGQIETVLSHADSPAAACRLLCDSAQDMGSRDDLTAALIF